MLKQQTVVDRIEILRDGVIQVRLTKEVVEYTTGQVLAKNYHRTAFIPGLDVDMQMKAVNEHLGSIGEVPVPDTQIDRIKQATTTFHTTEVIEAYRLKQREAKEGL